MTRTITIAELQANAEQLLAALSPGDELIIFQNGKPLAHIQPAPASPPANQPRVPGLWQGKVWMADDFDADLPESYWLGAE